MTGPNETSPPSERRTGTSKEFVLVDVFTRRAYRGNQLAVLPDARGLSTEAMQAIAREFNFAESTFVLPANSGGAFRRVRIFTPRNEMPFAGHPTLGTAAALAELGYLDASDGETEAVLEEVVGPVLVKIRQEGTAYFCRLTVESEVESPNDSIPIEEVASVLSLDARDVLGSWFAAAGPKFFFAHLKDAAAVDRAILDKLAWTRSLKGAWSPHIFLFSGETTPGSKLHARMFAPAAGIEEDLATGSASGILAGTLASRLSYEEGEFAWHLEQGVVLGRPSEIEASATKKAGRVTAIHVGGYSVVHGRGTLQVPCGGKV